MDNIVSYSERMLDGFDKTPFNAVDSLILAWMSYLRFPADMASVCTWGGARFAELFRAELFPTLFFRIWDTESSKRLFTAMAASPRFRDIRVMGAQAHFDTEQEKQFAALSYLLPQGEIYVAFRGTDSTLVGWKEDFNMAFQYPVPSQREALEYLEEAARHTYGKIRLGGHSKGGNLAVYAAANSSNEVKARIERVYSHDGPGFPEGALESDEFLSVEDFIDKTVPQSSLIGMIMERQENYRIITSSRVSVWQHDPFSWAVEGCDFVPSEALTPDARYLDRTLNEWLSSLSREERELFVDSIYRLVSNENAETFKQLRAEWKTALPSIIEEAEKLDPTTRKFLLETAQNLLATGVKNVPELWSAARNDEDEQGK